MKLNITKLSLAFGITWALFVLSIGWAGLLFGAWGDQLVATMASLYLGFDSTFLGGLIGAIWGFADGAIFGASAAYIYNLLK